MYWYPGSGDIHPFKETPVAWGTYLTNKHKYVVGVMLHMAQGKNERVVVVGFCDLHAGLSALRPCYSRHAIPARNVLAEHYKIAGREATEAELAWYLKLAPQRFATFEQYEKHRAVAAA